MQKIGYKFPGERCACYSSDLLLRQYKRVRSKKKKSFSYKDIKGVYTIVLFEKSPGEFHKFPDIYCHWSEQVSNTGLELNLLQEYVFIALDIYKEIYHNKVINRCNGPFNNKLEAWLALLCMDNPEVVIQLIEQYPDFKAMYEEAYQLCLNVEEVMRMFSKELAELDKNTVQLMIDEMQEEINTQRDEINTQRDEINTQRDKLKDKDKVIRDKDKTIEFEQEKHRKMIRTIYSNIQDMEQTVQLTGCSVDEIETALK